MFEFFLHLFDTSEFPPRWECGSWSAAHGWLHILSDLGVWSAYFTIPCILGFFVLRRRDIPFRSLFWLFAAFILACGTSHLMEAVVFWWPAYRLAGVIKLLTALVSWLTILVLIPAVPRALAMRSPEELEREIAERERTTEELARSSGELRQMQSDLERRVQQRTAELARLNEALQAEIRQRQRSEEALRRSEEQLRRAIVDAPIPIILHAEDGEILQVSNALTRLTGYSKEELGDFDGWRALTHISAEAKAGAAGRAANVNGAQEQELTVTTRAGERRTWNIRTSSPGVLRDGRKFLIGMATDVTERKRAEEVTKFLANASATLAALVDIESTLEKVARLAVPFFAEWSAVDLADQDGTLRRLAVAHQDPNRLNLAQQLFQRYPPDPDAPGCTQAVYRTGKSELVTDLTDDLLVKTARDPDHLRLLRGLKLKSSVCVPLRASGKPLGVLTFANSVSGRNYTPADLALAEELAHRAAVAIENSRLYNELRQADQRKDEFLAMLAHELRNPLAPVRNALHILRLAEADHEQTEQARGTIERQVEHLVRLVDDLLDVSRALRGKIELHRERVLLVDVVARGMETASPVIEAQGHQFQVSLPAEPLWLDGDPVRLSQVVANLLNNAAKYTEPAGKIWLTAERQGTEAVLTIRDTGIGIAREMLPQVFDLFFQADRSIARSQGGLGIGLTLVRRLVELHGGTIEVHSAGPGQGSTFVVRLPTSDPPIVPDPKAEQDRSTAPALRRRVLVVDDNVDAADSLAMLVRLWGHDVEVAYDGPAAIQAAAKFRPEVVLLDIGLPGLSGYEVAQRLRQQPSFAGTLLVALTGYGREEDRRRSLQAGFDEHLVKPIDPDLLQALLQSGSCR